MGSYLRKILFQHSFRLRQHQDDVVRLLYLANCFHPQTFIKDLNTTGHSLAQIERASQIARKVSDNEYKNLESFNPDLIFHKLFFDPYSSWPEKTHNWLLLVTQREFFARKQSELYWRSIPWEKKYQQEVFTLINRLGLHQEIEPEREPYAGIALFNATESGLRRRLIQLSDMIRKESISSPEYLYLFCGEWKTSSEADFLKRLGLDDQFSIYLANKIYLMNALTTSGNGTGIGSVEPILYIEPPKGKKLHAYVNNTLLRLAKERPNLADAVIYISKDTYSKNEEHAYSQLVKAMQRTDPHTLEEFRLSQASNRGLAALGRVFYHGYLPVALALGAKDSMQELELKKDRWSIAARSNLDKCTEWSNRRPKL